jgi:bisanhydrobacterioruberin hydratase
MEREESMKGRIALYLIFGFGVLWHALPVTHNLVIALTPAALLIAYIIILYPEVKGNNRRVITWLIVVYLITLIIEVVAVSTSLIFGEYEYGDTLGIEVAGVPLIIGLNWGFIIWGCSELVSNLKIPAAIRAFPAAMAAVALDFLIEPVAVSLDYWRWSGEVIPLQNYIAWFFIAYLFSLSYILLKLKSKTDLPVHFYFAQILFFGLMNFLKV